MQQTKKERELNRFPLIEVFRVTYVFQKMILIQPTPQREHSNKFKKTIFS